jgi:hypothetical protein
MGRCGSRCRQANQINRQGEINRVSDFIGVAHLPMVWSQRRQQGHGQLRETDQFPLACPKSQRIFGGNQV